MSKEYSLLCSDLHLSGSGGKRFDICAKQLLELVATLKSGYKGFKIGRLYVLGDVFDLTDRIPADALNLWIEFLTNVRGLGINVFWLTGQHDLTRKDVCSLTSLPSDLCVIYSKDISIVSKANNVYMLPFFRAETPDDFKEWANNQFKRLAVSKNKSILLTHNVIAPYVKSGVDVSFFKGFKRVISGDCHVGGKKNNFEFIGMGVQRNFSDADALSRYGILDEITGDVEFFTYNSVLLHTTITTKEDLKFFDKYVGKNCFFNIRWGGNNVLAEAKSIVAAYLKKLGFTEDHFAIALIGLVSPESINIKEFNLDNDKDLQEVLATYVDSKYATDKDSIEGVAITKQDLLKVGLQYININDQ